MLFWLWPESEIRFFMSETRFGDTRSRSAEVLGSAGFKKTKTVGVARRERVSPPSQKWPRAMVDGQRWGKGGRVVWVKTWHVDMIMQVPSIHVYKYYIIVQLLYSSMYTHITVIS